MVDGWVFKVRARVRVRVRVRVRARVRVRVRRGATVAGCAPLRRRTACSSRPA